MVNIHKSSERLLPTVQKANNSVLCFGLVAATMNSRLSADRQLQSVGSDSLLYVPFSCTRVFLQSFYRVHQMALKCASHWRQVVARRKVAATSRDVKSAHHRTESIHRRVVDVAPQRQSDPIVEPSNRPTAPRNTGYSQLLSKCVLALQVSCLH